ncbi:MAG: hypothetical protein P1U56_10735 [Saprospiraceae bacterium]|nr:hypothetical protein [Saprospiraceae bacterium]
MLRSSELNTKSLTNYLHTVACIISACSNYATFNPTSTTEVVCPKCEVNTSNLERQIKAKDSAFGRAVDGA